jgi:hypothetical protein
MESAMPFLRRDLIAMSWIASATILWSVLTGTHPLFTISRGLILIPFVWCLWFTLVGVVNWWRKSESARTSNEINQGSEQTQKQIPGWPTMTIIGVVLLAVGVNNTIRVSRDESSYGIISACVRDVFVGTETATPTENVYDVDHLTKGMIVGRSQDDDIYDIAFPGDMMPNVDVITAQGKSAQIIYSIRIAQDSPIMMLKLVHFSQSNLLGVQQVTVTSGTESATHPFPSNMVSRQTVDGGAFEFATMVPFVEPTAGQFLDVTRDSDAYNVEVKGANGFTTFSPGATARTHASQMLRLHSALTLRPDFVKELQRNALSFADYQKALMHGP